MSHENANHTSQTLSKAKSHTCWDVRSLMLEINQESLDGEQSVTFKSPKLPIKNKNLKLRNINVLN